MKFNATTAIVTGCGGMTGRAIAVALAGNGADIAVVTLKSDQQEFVEEIKKCDHLNMH